MAILLALVVSVALAVGGCGGGGGGGSAAEDGGGAAVETQTDATSGDDAAYESVVLAYFDAIAAGDVEGTCELVSSKAAGNCEQSISSAVDDPTMAEIVDGVTYDGVIEADQGGALVGFTGGNGNTGVIELVNEDGETKILSAVGL